MPSLTGRSTARTRPGGARPTTRRSTNGDPYWRHERSWKRFLDPRHPYTRLGLGFALSFFPVLGPVLVLSGCYYFACARSTKVCLSEIAIAMMFLITFIGGVKLFDIGFTINGGIQWPEYVDFGLADAWEVAPETHQLDKSAKPLLIVYYVSTTIASILLLLLHWRDRDERFHIIRQDTSIELGTMPQHSNSGGGGTHEEPRSSSESDRGLLGHAASIHGASHALSVQIPEGAYHQHPQSDSADSSSSGHSPLPFSAVHRSDTRNTRHTQGTSSRH